MATRSSRGFDERQAAPPIPASRFDLKWGPERSPVIIAQPFVEPQRRPSGVRARRLPLHRHRRRRQRQTIRSNSAQNPSTLLGKMLRIDVAVADGHPNGYVMPADNPFVSGTLPRRTAGDLGFGLRNPWRYSFDRGARRDWRAGDRRRRSEPLGGDRLRAAPGAAAATTAGATAKARSRIPIRRRIRRRRRLSR